MTFREELALCFAEQRRLAALMVLIGTLIGGCGAKPSYLGATVPAACTARDTEGCLGWMTERDLHAVDLELYEDTALRRYVQGVADRLARHALLDAPARVMIADRDDTYATSGRRIVISRTTIEKLASEAELAAVLAHELAHLEGRHTIVSLFGAPPDEGFVNRRDAEAIADERAVWLLERAGYAPTAMGNALRAVLEAEDDEHPLRADRIARATVLAGGRTGAVERDAFLDQLAGMVVGRDPRLGRRVERAWIVSVLGVALELGRKDDIRSDTDVLALRRGEATLVAYAIGAPWGKELAAQLEDREVVASPLGEVAMGSIPYETPADATPLGKLARAVRATHTQPEAGSRVAILVRPEGALVVEIGGRATPALELRAPTEDELAAVRPTRMTILRAPAAGALGELRLAGCALLLDDPKRVVAAGDRIKCATK